MWIIYLPCKYGFSNNHLLDIFWIFIIYFCSRGTYRLVMRTRDLETQIFGFKTISLLQCELGLLASHIWVSVVTFSQWGWYSYWVVLRYSGETLVHSLAQGNMVYNMASLWWDKVVAWFGTIWCDDIWSGVMWYGCIIVWYDVACYVVWYVVWCDTMCSVVWDDTVKMWCL